MIHVRAFLFALLLLPVTLMAQDDRDWGEFLSPRGRMLDLSNRGMVELPWQELQPDIEVLILDGNDLRELPGSLGKMCPRLRALSVRDNQLQEIGPFVTGLRYLEELYLDGNQIRGLGIRLRLCRNLRVLSIQDNDLSQTGMNWSSIGGLEVLLLDGNDLFAVPSEVGSLRNLRELSLADNRVDYVDADLGRCEFLEVLDVSGNGRLQKIPASLRFLDKLFYIDVAETGIDTVPDWVEEMTGLEYFVLEVR